MLSLLQSLFKSHLNLIWNNFTVHPNDLTKVVWYIALPNKQITDIHYGYAKLGTLDEKSEKEVMNKKEYKKWA